MFLCIFWFSVVTRAQIAPSRSLSRGTWEVEVFAGGGTGLFAASGDQFALAGVRIGRILTRDHFHGWAQGNFEFAGEIAPLFEVFQAGHAVYGGNFSPVILKWNFTRPEKVIPYVLLSGGGLVTTRNVPPGNTSYFNFVAGGSAGVHVFLRQRRALTFETHWVHISNANLGTQNPQLVSNFIFTAGYSWYR
jgi:hypothetical protein